MCPTTVIPLFNLNLVATTSSTKNKRLQVISIKLINSCAIKHTLIELFHLLKGRIITDPTDHALRLTNAKIFKSVDAMFDKSAVIVLLHYLCQWLAFNRLLMMATFLVLVLKWRFFPPHLIYCLQMNVVSPLYICISCICFVLYVLLCQDDKKIPFV